MGLIYRSQSSGQAKILNKKVKLILEKMVNRSCKDCSSMFDDTYKTPIGMTPYKLIYRVIFRWIGAQSL